MKDKISIFDTGPGMDASDENSIVKWYVTAAFLILFIVKVISWWVGGSLGTSGIANGECTSLEGHQNCVFF